MWSRFSEQAKKVVFAAQEEATVFGEGYVSTEHLLLGLLKVGGLVSQALQRLGVDTVALRATVIKQLPRGESMPIKALDLTPRAKRVLDLAYDSARGLNCNWIGAEHLILGLIREGDGLAARCLKQHNVSYESLFNVVKSMLEETGHKTLNKEEQRRSIIERLESMQSALSLIVGELKGDGYAN